MMTLHELGGLLAIGILLFMGLRVRTLPFHTRMQAHEPRACGKPPNFVGEISDACPGMDPVGRLFRHCEFSGHAVGNFLGNGGSQSLETCDVATSAMSASGTTAVEGGRRK